MGTGSGPERALAEAVGVPFVAVATGKLRRYLDWQNVVDAGRVPVGSRRRPASCGASGRHVAFGAGGFAAVPPLVAAALGGVPVLIHQQDVGAGAGEPLTGAVRAADQRGLSRVAAAFPAAAHAWSWATRCARTC